MIVEKSFPRGGVSVKDSKEAVKKKDHIIFGAVQTKVKKTKAKKSASTPEELLEQQKNQIIETHSAELLNYETIQDGMNIMGMVSAVDDLFVTVSLPGRMTARISALEISDAYTKAAREFLENTDHAKNFKTLQELYEVGQLVYGRVQEIKQQQKFARPEILMTLKPAEVHSELIHTNIKKGFIFNGAISEVQEHGFIIESGIKGLRAFLPLDDSEKDLSLGQLVFLKVDKITVDKTASTCICKQMQPEQLKVKSLQSDPNLDYILPSCIVSFEVTKCLKDGLKGTIMNEAFTAYVNEHQLGEPLMLPEDYEIKKKYNARILYVMPLTKFVYLTLNLQNRSTKNEAEDGSNIQQFKRGDIIEDARVHHIGTGGVVLVLKNQFKGLISHKTMRANYKGNYDQDELLNKYSKKSKHKVRVLDYDLMDSMYICSDNTNVVDEKYFALDDLKPGDFVTAILKSYNKAIGGYNLQVGKVKGIIERLYLTPGSKQIEPKTKIRCRVISSNPERNTVYLTNRVEYMAKNCKLLMNTEDARKNNTFMGTIVRADEEYFLVKFFNGVTGRLFKNRLSGSFLSKESSNLEVGQTMLFRILMTNGTRITLGLVDDVCKVGEICSTTVTHILQTGLEVNVHLKVENEESDKSNELSERTTKGMVPIRLLSDFLDLVVAKSRIYPVNSKIQTVSLHKNIFSIRDVPYFEEFGVKDWQTLAPGDILRAYVENVNGDIVELFVPIRGYNKLVKIHLKMLLLRVYDKPNVMLHPEQVIFVKVVGKDKATKTISVTAQLTSVWDQKLTTTASYVESYLSEVNQICKELKKQSNPISHFKVGEKITVTFNGVNKETNDWQYQDEKTKIYAIARASIITGSKLKIPEQGSKHEVVVLWIDYSNNFIYISPKPADVKHITNSTKLPEEFANAQQVYAKVLLKLEQIFICSLKKGPNPLIFCPINLHYNDFEHAASGDVNEGDFCKLSFIHKTKPIAVLQQTYNIWQRISNNKRKSSSNEEPIATQGKQMKLESKIENDEPNSKKTKKTKLSITKEDTETMAKKSKLSSNESNAKSISQNALKAKKSISSNELNDKVTTPHKPKENIESTTTKVSSSSMLFYEDTKPNASKPIIKSAKTLSGVTDFWTTDLTQLEMSNNIESSDDDDDDATNTDSNGLSKQKKKRLSAVEKFKKEREEEARLREIEAQYADLDHLPETVDQFDRLVLSEPNNSKHWINYMVFHLQSAEIDKARAVARRAVKAISMRNSDDHLNIWIALLNLETRYGSRETFDSTLKEALTFNEPIKVYLRVVEILREAKKEQELIEIVGIITKKFKGNQEVWKAAADAYFSMGMVEKAQQMLHKSLASLPEREHVNTIVMFANLNHRHGANEMAHTLLDQVVTSYPKRVDVWTQYVDMLVKDQLIDSARSVLERAIIQKIPIKKMRTIFKKYLEFEERHGNADGVEKVKRLATDYVKNNTNLEA